MAGSPLIFTYNNPKTIRLKNVLKNDDHSIQPGTTLIEIYNILSPNINLQNAILTLQYISNSEEQQSNSVLNIDNATLIASVENNVIGTLSYVLQYQNPTMDNEPVYIRARLSKLSSFVNSATGIFANYLFGNVIYILDNQSGERTISIYSPL